MENEYFKIENKANGDAIIVVDGFIHRWGDNSAKNLSSQIKNLSKKSKKITININSGGGDVFEGIAIVNAINDSEAHITTRVTGIAASMGSIIAVSGDSALISKYGKLMIHKPMGGAHGQSSKLREVADAIDEAEDSLVAIIADKRGLDAEVVRTKYFKANKDVWLSASKAVDAGLMDSEYSISNVYQFPSDFEKYSIAAQMDFYSAKEYSENTNQKQKQKEEDMDIVATRRALGLTDDATEGVVIGALYEVIAERDSLKAKVSQMDKDAKAGKLKGLQNSVEQAVIEGKITASQKAVYLAMAESDADGLVTALGTLTAKKKLEVNGKSPDGAIDGKKWDEIDPAVRAQLKEDNLEKYKALYLENYGTPMID